MLRTLTFLACLTAASHASAKNNLSTADYWEWRNVSSPQISHDGKTVVYVVGWNDRMNDAMHSNLWMAAADGRDNRPITQGSFRDTSPRWSPDGTRLAYITNRGGKTQIHVRWMDSGQEAAITDLEDAPANIAWSPDGKWIAYQSRSRKAFMVHTHAGKTGGREVGRAPDHRHPSALAAGRAGADQAGLHSHFHRARHRRRATADFIRRI